MYSWKAKDKDFKKKLEDALSEGEENINEMSEVQLVSMIKEKNWQAVSFWLRHRHPKFKDKIEIDTTIRTQNNELTPEQNEAVKRALKFAGLIEGPAEPENNQNIINNDQNNGNSKQQSTHQEQNLEMKKTQQIPPENNNIKDGEQPNYGSGILPDDLGGKNDKRRENKNGFCDKKHVPVFSLLFSPLYHLSHCWISKTDIPLN